MQPLNESRNNRQAGMRRLIVGAAALWAVLLTSSLIWDLCGIPWSPLIAILSHSVLWILGLAGLASAIRYFRRQDEARTHIEGLLRDSEAKYRTVADFTYDWEYWIDHGRLLYVSPACERITGYRPDEFIADPGLLQRIVHPDDRPAVEQHFSHYSGKLDQTETSLDFRIITRQGETRWINHHGLPVFNRGIYQGSRISNRDISRRKQTETELWRTTCLLESIHKVQTIYLSEADPERVFKELLNILVKVTDSEYGFLNEVLQDESGGWYEASLALSDIAWDEESRRLSDERLAGKLELCNLHNLLGVPALTGQRVIANDAPHDPRSGGLPPGHPPLYHYLGMPIYFGNEVIGVAGVANRMGGYDDALADWLEPFLSTCASILHAMRLERRRQQAEQALRDSAGSMAAILNSLPESAFLMARDGTILSVNQTLARRLGHPVSALLGANAYALIPPVSCQQQIETVFQTAEQVQFEDVREDRIFDNHVYPVLDDQGAVTRVAIFAADITEQRQVEEALWLANLYNRNLLEASLDALVVIDPDGRISDVNAATEQMTGYLREELLGTDFSAYFTEPERTQAGYQQAFAQGEIRDYELAIRHCTGRLTPVLYNAAVCQDESGEIIGVVAAARDMTERKRTEDALHVSEARYRRIVETANEGIWAMDEHHLITFVNSRMAVLLGYAIDEVLGQPVTAFMFEADLSDYRDKMDTWQQGGDAQYEWRFRCKDGSELWALVSAVALTDDQFRFRGSFAMLTDMTLLKSQQQQLEQMAYYDVLTQLPNRRLLADRFHLALAQARRTSCLLAICYLDLDGFKPVNDTFGHEAGDRLLLATAGRLKQCLREGDTVARLGGDEFVLLLGGLSDVAECERALHRLLAAIAEPYALGDGLLPVTVSASVGVTLFPLDHADPDILLRHADQAMYEAKHSGRNCYCRFAES